MDGLWLIHFTGRTFKVTTTNHSSDPQTNLPYPSPTRLRVVPHFSSGIVERAKRERA